MADHSQDSADPLRFPKRLQDLVSHATYEFEYLLPLIVRATAGSEAGLTVKALAGRLDTVRSALIELVSNIKLGGDLIEGAAMKALEGAERLLAFGDAEADHG